MIRSTGIIDVAGAVGSSGSDGIYGKELKDKKAPLVHQVLMVNQENLGHKGTLGYQVDKASEGLL